MLTPERQIGEVDSAMLASIQASIDDEEEHLIPSCLEEAQYLLGRFNIALINYPELFTGAKKYAIIRRLKKAVEQRGVTLEQLETCEFKLRQYVRRMLEPDQS